MPTLDELGCEIEVRLGRKADQLRRLGGNLEERLSFLAAPQPWLTDEENLRNEALFGDIARLINQVISERELRAVASPVPDWFVRMALGLARESARLITFNYDRLLERCLRQEGVVSDLADLYAIPLAQRQPAGIGMMLSSNSPKDPDHVPSLMKLHGSLGWLYGGRTASVSEELFLTSGSRLQWDPSPDQRMKPPRYDVLYDHKVPLIIPPTASKSGYYSNLALRAQWRLASEAIRSAPELVFIGYSLPAMDLQARQMIKWSCRGAPHLTVVDPSPDSCRRVEELLHRAVDMHYGEPDAVKRFVSERWPG